ncbi:15217_t:CDS:2, partial [Dentiscutata heterogama]
KKDIIAIQKKLGINSNTLKQIEHEPDGKTLTNSYKLLLYLVEDLILIQKNLDIDGNLILAVEYNNKELDIVGYTNGEIAEEANKNASVYLQKFEKFYGPLEDDLGVLIKKFADIGVKKIWFTGEGLPLFLNVSPQQLHKIFVKKSASANQCPCLETK